MGMLVVSKSNSLRNSKIEKGCLYSNHTQLLTSSTPEGNSSKRQLDLPQPKHVCTIAMNAITTLPALATGKVFDFNASLPAMVVNFLLLMVFLETTWFGPVGKVLDERDAKIRSRLNSVKTGDDELESLTKESESLLKDARSEAQNKIADARSKAAAKAAAKLTAEKSKLDEEIAQTVKSLENEKTSTQKDIDQQVDDLSAYIIKRVLP